MTESVDIPKRARLEKGAGHLLRAEVLAVAERIFIAEGFEGATIRKIAQEVGVSSTALYMHFADKGEMLFEIARRSILHLIERNELLAAQPMDPAERVRSMLRSYMEYATAHPNAYQLVFGQPLPLNEERLAAIRELGQRCFAPFSRAVEALAEEGRLQGDSAAVAAQVAWAAAHGIVSLQLNRPKFPWAGAAEELQAATIDYLFGGLLRAG